MSLNKVNTSTRRLLHPEHKESTHIALQSSIGKLNYQFKKKLN